LLDAVDLALQADPGLDVEASEPLPLCMPMPSTGISCTVGDMGDGAAISGVVVGAAADASHSGSHENACAGVVAGATTVESDARS